MPTLANHANLSDAQAHRLLAEVKPLRTMEEVVAWGRAGPTERPVLDVLVQDAHCHDVVMEWELGKHLVFDTTCLGEVKTVSVWDYRPSPEEILQMRVASGWQPAMGEGAHAACIVTDLGIA